MDVNIGRPFFAIALTCLLVACGGGSQTISPSPTVSPGGAITRVFTAYRFASLGAPYAIGSDVITSGPDVPSGSPQRVRRPSAASRRCCNNTISASDRFSVSGGHNERFGRCAMVRRTWLQYDWTNHACRCNHRILGSRYKVGRMNSSGLVTEYAFPLSRPASRRHHCRIWEHVLDWHRRCNFAL